MAAFWLQASDLYISAKLTLALLILSGCTTTSDHVYFASNDALIDDTIRAARYCIPRSSHLMQQKPIHVVSARDTCSSMHQSSATMPAIQPSVEVLAPTGCPTKTIQTLNLEP